MTWLRVALGVLLVLALDGLLLAAERRGFLYYRKRKPSPGSLSSAVARMSAFIEPGKERVAEVQQKPHVEQAEQGGPPTGAGGRLTVTPRR